VSNEGLRFTTKTIRDAIGTPASPRAPRKLANPRISATHFERDVDEKKAWTVIKKRLDGALQLTSNRRASGNLTTNLKRIDDGFRFNTDAQDNQFILWHVE